MNTSSNTTQPQRPTPKKYHRTRMHDFKTHIAKYLRWLERGEYDGIIIQKYDEDVAFFMAVKPRINALDAEKNEKAAD